MKYFCAKYCTLLKTLFFYPTSLIIFENIYDLCLVWLLPLLFGILEQQFKKKYLLLFCQNPCIVLSGIITSIEVEIEQQLQIPMFMINDIKKHYQDQLKYLNAPDNLIQNVHIIRLKTKTFRRVPQLWKQKEKKKKDKIVVLTLD